MVMHELSKAMPCEQYSDHQSVCCRLLAILQNLAPADNVIITDVSRWLRDAHTVLTLHPHAAHQLARDAPTCSVLHRAAHTHTEHANTTTDTMTVDAARADLVGSRSEWAPLLCEASVAPRAVTALAVPSEPGALPVVAVCVSGGEVVLWSLRQCRYALCKTLHSFDRRYSAYRQVMRPCGAWVHKVGCLRTWPWILQTQTQSMRIRISPHYRSHARTHARTAHVLWRHCAPWKSSHVPMRCDLKWR